MSLYIPAKLDHLRQLDSGAQWIEQIPELVRTLSDEWDLTVGRAFETSSVSYTAPATRAGEHVVLKIQWPHDECEFEADALQCWNGAGAVKLLAHNRDKHALLLEHCQPGISLGNSDLKDKLAPLIELLPKLWVAAPVIIKSLEEEAIAWQRTMLKHWEEAGRPMSKSIVLNAMEYIDHLVGSQHEQVLLHQDLHGDNILSATRDNWLAIDPKPLRGEREFSVAPIVRSAELGHSQNLVVERLDRLCKELDLNRERSRRWTVAQTVAWGLEGGPHERAIDVVEWLEEA